MVHLFVRLTMEALRASAYPPAGGNGAVGVTEASPNRIFLSNTVGHGLMTASSPGPCQMSTETR